MSKITKQLFLDNVPDTVPELIDSFSKLILNASGDTNTLNKFQEMINTELERVSSLDSNSDIDDKYHDVDDSPQQFTSTPINKELKTLPNGFLVHHNRIPEDHNSTTEPDAHTVLHNFSVSPDILALVEHVPHINLTDELYNEILDELNGLDLNSTSNAVRTKWLSPTDEPYNYAKVKNDPLPIRNYPKINKLMDIVNAHPSTTQNMDCCLITRYPNASSSLGLHKDADRLTCQSSSICTVSFGAPRELICVLDGKANQTLDIILSTVDWTMKIMKPGVQQVMKYGVRPAASTPGLSTVRYSVSFRKIASDTYLSPSAPPLILPAAPTTPTPLIPEEHPHNETQSSNVAGQQQSPNHLIIGDSLVKGMRVPGSISICKGGICPGELLQLLPGSVDILHPDQYGGIRTVTVIVGTNALNVKRKGKGMPLLDVVEDYERMIHDIKRLFPNARIGLYNVIPRAYTCIETVSRIQLFNTIFENHVVNKNVFWIKQYWDFLDNNGFLRNDLYGKLGIHLKGKGKGMMARCIKNFQNSYN